MDYINDCRIDETAIDLEWLNQPSLAMKYGFHWAGLQKEFEAAEEKMKIKFAELTDLVNSDPVAYLGEGVKVTLGNVDSYISRHPTYQKLKNQVVELRHETNMAKIAYQEISNSRKSALENLVKLLGQNYFAAPNVPKDLNRNSTTSSFQERMNEKIRFKRTNTKE